MKSNTVVVKVNVAASTRHTYMGTRNELVAQELRVGGIPAVAGPNGIHVKTGSLHVYEHEGMRVFEWAPPDTQEQEAEVTEMQASDEQEEKPEQEQPARQQQRRRRAG